MSVRLCLKLSGQCADPEIVRQNFNKIMRFLCEFVVTCVPVEMQWGSEEATPDGVIGVPYNYTVHLIGTQPFEIHDIICPDWMTVTLLEDDITFSGTPDALATDLGISFFVTNCTSDQINFGAFIDVLDGTGSGSGDCSAWVERFTNGGGDMLSVVDLLDPSVQTVFLKATTDDTIVLIPNPKIFDDATEVTNTLWIMRADAGNDPGLNVGLLISDGSEGTIDGETGLPLAPGQTIMFQSNGEEYKILFNSAGMTGGSGDTGGRFGIEDNLGIQDRAVDMEHHGFNLTNASGFLLQSNDDGDGLDTFQSDPDVDLGSITLTHQNTNTGAIVGLQTNNIDYNVALKANNGVVARALICRPDNTVIAIIDDTLGTIPAFTIDRQTADTLIDGIGASFDFDILTSDDPLALTANQLISKWTTVNTATRSSELSFTGVDSAATNILLQISGSGLFTLPLGLQDFANDAAAAGGGIPVNGIYRNGSAMQIRVS